MNILNLFKSATTISSIAEKTTDGIISSLDKLVFTDEEKSDVSMQTVKLYLKFNELTANENTVRSITRRILAVSIMGAYLFLIILSGIIFKIDPDWSTRLFGCAKELSSLTIAIGILYFGPYQLSKLFNKEVK